MRRFFACRALPGFTLLELAVVLFIMALVMLAALPYLGGFRRSQLKSEARRLAGRTNYLYEEAGAQKVLLRLTFDLDRNRYSVSRMDPISARPRFAPEGGPAGHVVNLPNGIRLRDVWVEGIGDLRRGTISTQFYPGGTADAALIHLADDGGGVFTLAVNPYNGRTAIARGDLSREAMAALPS
jgi:prepilin-type N-terminal cleavage/methylation domain-containing protein